MREGGQLLAGGGALSVVGLDLVETGLLEETRRFLCPGSGALPEAELHALNVYTPRGHSVRHEDTPRDRACFGTLVACLPVGFRGGRLVLRSESTRVYDWDRDTDDHWGRRGKPYEVRWAAFYGDVDHEIEPVTSGTRVTLTWLLRGTELLGELEYSATDYFGNEGSHLAFYATAALLIDVPPAWERGATRPKRRARSRSS